MFEKPGEHSNSTGLSVTLHVDDMFITAKGSEVQSLLTILPVAQLELWLVRDLIMETPTSFGFKIKI